MTQEEIKAIRYYQEVIAKEEYTNRDILFLTEVNGISKNINKNLDAYINN